jgi:hypothetical protein
VPPPEWVRNRVPQPTCRPATTRQLQCSKRSVLHRKIAGQQHRNHGINATATPMLIGEQERCQDQSGQQPGDCCSAIEFVVP